MDTDDRNDQSNTGEKNRFTEWLGQNTHMTSLGQRLPLLQLRRSDHPGLDIGAWAGRIASPIQNLAGYIHGKFQRTSLSGKTAGNIHWLSRRKKPHDQDIDHWQTGYPGRIGPESSTGEYSGYNTGDNILSPKGVGPVDRQAHLEGPTVSKDQGSVYNSSHYDVPFSSIDSTKKLSEGTGQRIASLRNTHVQSAIRDQVKSLTENRLYPKDIIQSKSESPSSKQDVMFEVQPSLADYTPQKRDIPDSSKGSEYAIQKDSQYSEQSDLSGSQSESAGSAHAAEIPLNRQTRTSEAYSTIPTSQPVNITARKPDTFAAPSPVIPAARKIAEGISGKTGAQSNAAISPTTKEATGSIKRLSHTSAKQPIARLIQTKAAGHIERLTYLPQKIIQNTTNTIVQSRKPLYKESAAGEGISGYETTRQANIPLARSISRLEAEQGVPFSSESIQTKSTGHTERQPHQPQMLQNTMDAFVQAHRQSPAQHRSAEGDWSESSITHTRKYSESAASEGISVGEIAQQVSIPASQSISRMETDQGIPSMSPSLQKKSAGYIGMPPHLQQKRSKNLMKAFMQAHQLSPEQEISAEGKQPESSLPYRRIDSETTAGEKMSGHEPLQQANIPMSHPIARSEAERGVPSISQSHISEGSLEGQPDKMAGSLLPDVQESSIGYRKTSQVEPSLFKYAHSIGHQGQFLQRSVAKIMEFSKKHSEAGSGVSPAAENIQFTRMDHPASPGQGEVSGVSNSVYSDQIEREHVSVPQRLASIQGKTMQTKAFKSDVGIPAIQMAYPKQKTIDDNYSAFTSDTGSFHNGATSSGSLHTFLDRKSNGSSMTIMPETTGTDEIQRVIEQQHPAGAREQQAGADIDIDSIAQKVYQILKRKLAIERERRGVNF